MSQARKLKDSVAKKGLFHVMATHSPISAMLAEEAGFDGLWASGFELSALYGLPDAWLITMTQHLDMLRAIASKSTLPVIADIDTGYGNAINVLHAVKEYERAGAAAVVIEDKVFPKMSSLVAGGRQELVRIDEFQGKIEAACDARIDKDFLIIARTEALIAGLGQDEALARAKAYVDAGADMILIHSKQEDPNEIEQFARVWKERSDVGLVIVPNAYPELDATRIKELGSVRVVIYGNYGIRAAVKGMKDAFKRIIENGGVQHVHKDIVPVDEIFRLQGMDKVKVDEKRFLK
ncbi:phosphoenolpyruvate mutase [Polyplosphaeria fusca]|uniref:Phosphoenolpyruvate mutase n=1 Tax=Polyplosphaeria fusca TaxID=682080 RepID=A0A9P4R4G7_9PLEO|nr:phosphoenolpyruvate mutase [Polyplosphaeria fusca]